MLAVISIRNERRCYVKYIEKKNKYISGTNSYKIWETLRTESLLENFNMSCILEMSEVLEYCTFICEVETALLRSVNSYFCRYLFLHMLVQLQVLLITNLKDVEIVFFFP